MSEQLVTSVSPEQVRDRLDAYLKIASDVASLTNNKVDDFLVNTLNTYKNQDWFVSLLVFVLNRVLPQENPTLEDVKSAFEAGIVQFSNK